MSGGDPPGWVLVLNCGSSSVKLAVVDPLSGRRRLTGLAETVGGSDTVVRVRRGDSEESSRSEDPSLRGVVTDLLGALTPVERDELVGVGHRVVHGGASFSESVLLDEATRAELNALVPLAPLHLPASLVGIEVTGELLPDTAQVAVFDTAFHQTLPPVAYRYAVPTAWYEGHGVRRYGFHGISHRYVGARAAELLGRPLVDLRLITMHLGNGCSATAIQGGRSIDTTMGLTPLEGLVMGSRSGDVDPGLLGYVAERLALGVDEVIEALNTRSGLLGLSGLSHDMRTLCEAATHGSATAQLAIDVFCYRAAKSVGALMVALEGLDALVFTGGIGERSAEVRRGVLARLGALGLTEEPDANAAHGRHTRGRVSEAGERSALVVPTDEELLIARDTAEVTRYAAS